jgi:hypothetical protein
VRRPSILLVVLLAAAAAAAAAAPAARAESWRVDEQRSTFAVLTHRAGPAARLAHEHLIVARGARVELEFDREAPESTRFRFAVPVLALDADPAAERAALTPRLETLGVLAEPLSPIEEDDRGKIRKAMLAPDQLFAERYPEVRAELLALERRGGDGNARVALGWNARVRIEVRGVAVERDVPARWELVDGELRAELLAELAFTDFSIEPYSAVLGAIRNADLFHVYVELVAVRESP